MKRRTAAAQRLGSLGVDTWVKVKGRKEGRSSLINNTLYMNKGEQATKREHKENDLHFNFVFDQGRRYLSELFYSSF